MPTGIYKHKSCSEKTKEKIRQKTLRQFKNGMPKKTKEKLRQISLRQFENGMSEKTKRKISEGNKGKIGYWKNKKRPIEARLKASISMMGKNFKNGLSSLNEKIRKSVEYKLWREAIFERDDYTCQKCGNKNGNGKSIILNVHHIKEFHLILDEYKITTYKESKRCKEFWDINNGITLCKKCHKEIHKRI